MKKTVPLPWLFLRRMSACTPFLRSLAALLSCGSFLFATAAEPAPSTEGNAKARSGNPIFPGWYADPEGAVFGNNYWVYPTYSAPYDQQVFLDAFSSPDLVNWTRHSRIVDTNAVTWARSAMWAPAIVEQAGRYFLFFSANDIRATVNWAASESPWPTSPRGRSKII